MKKSVLMLGAGCALLASAAETTRLWPDAGMRVVPGDCAQVTRVGEELRVDVGTCKKTVWPAAYFTFASTTNLAGVGAIRVTFTNHTDSALSLHAKVKATTV